MKKLLSLAIIGSLLTTSMIGSSAFAAKRQYVCKNLTFAQAQKLLKQGHRYLDRDRDGIACEANKR